MRDDRWKTEGLSSCGVLGGSTVQDTSSVRRRVTCKDKKSKAEKRQAVRTKGPEPLRRHEVSQKMIGRVCESNDTEGEQKLQSFLATIQMSSGLDEEQMEHLECQFRVRFEVKRRSRSQTKGAGRRAGARHARQSNENTTRIVPHLPASASASATMTAATAAGAAAAPTRSP